ncbi:hypothetical protein ACFXHA_34145 [Nocardia sp. NPDC059240]|uniref:hypothetical protein n=1 Tax=Nocardia sp. NPDC059240 TaxID=3346786 RepID=UPI0036748EBB
MWWQLIVVALLGITVITVSRRLWPPRNRGLGNEVADNDGDSAHEWGGLAGLLAAGIGRFLKPRVWPRIQRRLDSQRERREGRGR